jgi:hypothetical protein
MTIYRERLWASAWLFISTALVIPASLLVFLPINFGAGVIVAAILYAGCVFVLIANSPVVEVTTAALIEFIGYVSGYLGEDATMQRGRELDARAWLMIRGWVSPVVKVDVLDASDPTPYWIVSTRHPDRVIAAISRARGLVES